MKRIQPATWSFFALSMAVALAATSSAWASAPENRPNIVLILADDLGVNDLACYGRSEHRTPHLDRLAGQGIRFTSAYAAGSVCSPTRAALMTGKAPARLHITNYLPGRTDRPSHKLLQPVIRQQLPLEEVTLAEYLQRLGYATGSFGKWHLGGRGFSPLQQGFDEQVPSLPLSACNEVEGARGEFHLTRAAARFMTKHRDRPFFVVLGHDSPHIPFRVSEDRAARHRNAFEPVYAALIEMLDESVGQLLAHLEELRLQEKTLVIFTSDNGGLHVPEGGHERITHNTPFRAGKGFLYEGGIRVPLLVRWPGRITPGRVSDTPVISHDWVPTLLDLLGAPVSDGLDGISIAAELLGTEPLPKRMLFWHQPNYTNQGGRPSGAVRDGDWKLIEHYEDGRRELFDLRTDAGETRDLSGMEAEQTRRLSEALDAWRKAVSAQLNTPNPAFDPAAWRRCYEQFDPSRYQPQRADQATQEQARQWRKAMDAASR